MLEFAVGKVVVVRRPNFCGTRGRVGGCCVYRHNFVGNVYRTGWDLGEAVV